MKSWRLCLTPWLTLLLYTLRIGIVVPVMFPYMDFIDLFFSLDRTVEKKAYKEKI